MKHNPEPVQSIWTERHPFPFLLYLEWGLLAIALLSELLPVFVAPVPRFRLLTLGCTVGFGLMGLRLPCQRSLQISYTALEIGLILLTSFSDGMRGVRLFPYFCLVLVIRSCLMFRLTERLLIAGITYVLFLGLLLYQVPNLAPRHERILHQAADRPLLGIFAFNSALLLGLSLLFVLLLVNALVTERRSREKLIVANEQLRQYALRVEHLAMAQERSRIAREIHDSLGHSLTALNLQLEAGLKLWQTNPARAQTLLQEAKQLGSTALQDVRHSVAAMRTDPLQGRSLTEAIVSLLQDMQRTTGIQPDYQLRLPELLASEVSITLYRIVQESLTNISKHANASRVMLRLDSTASDIRLQIQDNGTGFQPNQNQSGFGLQGMRERTLALGGQIEISSEIGRGCRITARFPRMDRRDDA